VTTFPGRVAAVTGAGSGIGRALARELASRGTHLALADINDQGLAETARLCEAVHVTSAWVDVGDQDAMHAWADRVVEDHGQANFIFNNAGVALMASVQAMSYADLDWLMRTNFWGVVYGTKAFLPYLKAAGDGHIINVSSVFGLISVPSLSAYNASKFAVRGFTDALRIELDAEDAGISCTTVHPGGVRTNIVRNARLDEGEAARAGGAEKVRSNFDRAALTKPEKAARQILAAVERNRRRAVIGLDGKVIDLLSRLPAGVCQRPLAWRAKAGLSTR
jgi:butyryl-CoA dehydrogenase